MATIKEIKDIPASGIIEIYQANSWSSANKPVELINGLSNSHVSITAWNNDKLIRLRNTLSDRYYPHLIIHPSYQKKRTGSMIMQKFQENLRTFISSF